MMDWSPRCYILSFVAIGLPVPEKKIFKGFLPYVAIAAILVMGQASCHQIFISLYLKAAFIQNLVKIGKVVSEKIRFEILYVHGLGPRSRNDLDLQYSHIFNKMMGWSPRCYIPCFLKIGPPVLEKIFEGFLLYMGVVAMLLM